jgi:hypothetical protein
MSLPPSNPSPEHGSQAGASAISWWQKNADNISVSPPPPNRNSLVHRPRLHNFPPSRITIPVQVSAAAAASSAPAQQPTDPSPTNKQSSTAPAPPSTPSGGSDNLIDLLSNDDVPGGTINVKGASTFTPHYDAPQGASVGGLTFPPNSPPHPLLLLLTPPRHHSELQPPNHISGVQLPLFINTTRIPTYSLQCNNITTCCPT